MKKLKVRIDKDSAEDDTMEFWDEKYFKDEMTMVKNCLGAEDVSSITIRKDEGEKKFFDYVIRLHDMYWCGKCGYDVKTKGHKHNLGAS